MMNEQELRNIREQFPIFAEKTYVATCSQGALSAPVAAAIEEHIASWHKYGLAWDLWIEKYEEARRSFAEFIGADPSEIAVLTSVSAGINAIASALDYSQRRNVVIGEFEFPTMGHIWLAQEKRGAELRWVRQQRGRIPAENYARHIDRDTCIVPVTGVCFMNGARSEVKEVTKVAHENGAFVMVDDYQDCGTRAVDVKELGIDFYLSGSLKYLLGSSGLAFMYVRRELISHLIPTMSSWISQEDHFGYHLERFELASTARRFETGTPAIQPIYTALPALAMLKRVGLDRIRDHVQRLSSALMRNASELGIELKTPQEAIGPLVVLRVKDVAQLLKALERAGIVASSRYDGLRISFHLYNSMADVNLITEVMEANLDLFVTQKVAASG
jgi:selenocysteine lyase/cysteine desulfurase